MDFVEETYKFVYESCNWHKENSQDHYDFWNEHIKHVYEEATKQAQKHNADLEIVKMGALLHDIALIKMVGTREEHHINGKKIAKDFLESINYPQERKERVLGCVLHHRSSKNAESNEELCVADSDILAHFDNIPMLFDLMFNAKKMSLEEVHKEMPIYLEKDFEDLSDRAKEDFKEEYELYKKVLID